MSAIFGFTGDPDDTLIKKMASQLSHRADRFPIIDHNHLRTFGLSTWSHQKSSHGIHKNSHRAIAIAGHVYDSESDSQPLSARTVLNRYMQPDQHSGLSCLNNLRGAFVMAIWDSGTLHLIRDAAGHRTIYYAQHAGRTYFAVEPKGVLAAPIPRRLRAAALAQYLTFSFIPGERTMLEDLHELPAGHIVTFKPEQRPQLKRYFFFERQHPDMQASRAQYPDADDRRGWVNLFQTSLAEAVRERIPANQPHATFLSGGLDSSVITAELARQCQDPIRTFSIHFGDKYPNELSFARQVAERCKTDHEEVLIRPKQFLPRLRQMIWHLDEPIGDPITMPNYELSARAAREVKYVFNGEGGDPLFGGPKNIPMLLQHWYGVPREPNFREQQYLASYRRGYEEIHRLLSPDMQKRINPEADLESVLSPYFSCDHSPLFLDKLATINIRLKGAHLILPKVERMCAAAGIEPLSPLFDERLIRLSFQMPARCRLSAGIEKIIIKDAYRERLPEDIIDRPKSGMRVPVHFWFKRELRQYAKSILSKRAVRDAGLFDYSRIKQLLDYDTEEGPGRYGLRLWMIITLEIWRRLVIEGEQV